MNIQINKFIKSINTMFGSNTSLSSKQGVPGQLPKFFTLRGSFAQKYFKQYTELTLLLKSYNASRMDI